MFSATHLPRCSACLASPRRQHLANSLAAIQLSLAIGVMSLATASMPAFADESHNHFVGPPSRLQPRLSNEMGTPRALPLVRPVALVNPVAQVLPLFVQAPTRLTDAESIPQPPFVAEPELLDQPTTSQQLASGDETIEPLPCYVAPPLSSIDINIALPDGDDFPANVALECAANTGVSYDARMEYGWAQFDFHWSATCLCHGPLYFEEINAERYGYTPSYVFQPFISAGRFFLSIPALPYKMAVDRPHDCIYTLGQYRPGSCVPRRWNHLPMHVGAAIVEVGTIAGLILLIP